MSRQGSTSDRNGRVVVVEVFLSSRCFQGLLGVRSRFSLYSLGQRNTEPGGRTEFDELNLKHIGVAGELLKSKAKAHILMICHLKEEIAKLSPFSPGRIRA